MPSTKRTLAVSAMATIACSLIACGPPELVNQTPESLLHVADQNQLFSAQVTQNGNALDEVNVVVNFGLFEMNTGGGGLYTRQVLLPNCQLLTPYTFNIEYDSALPSEPAGILYRREPQAGAYILRRTNADPELCRAYEGLSMGVTTTSDLVDANPGDGVCAAANGACSLRAAVMEANARNGHDRITLSSGPYVLTLTGGETLDEMDDSINDLDITDGVSIVGLSDGSVIDGDGESRIFQIVTTVYEYVNLTSLTLQNGFARGEPGGALYNDSSTKLDRVTLTENHLDPYDATCAANVALEVCNRGGAIFNKSRLLVLRSTVRRNFTCLNEGVCDTGQAGAIANFGVSAHLYLQDSTIAENSARFIGAVQNSEGTIEAVNTTFADNNPLHWVSAIYTTGGGSVALRHVTFSERADLPVLINSEVFEEFTDVSMESSVVHIDSELGSLCQGPLLSRQNNFVGGFSDDQDYVGSCDVSGFQPSTGELSVSSLADHGGPTDTIEIYPEDDELQVIDNGSVVCPDRDQRGFSRTDDADGAAKVGCDPGALEH